MGSIRKPLMITLFRNSQVFFEYVTIEVLRQNFALRELTLITDWTRSGRGQAL